MKGDFKNMRSNYDKKTFNGLIKGDLDESSLKRCKEEVIAIHEDIEKLEKGYREKSVKNLIKLGMKLNAVEEAFRKKGKKKADYINWVRQEFKHEHTRGFQHAKQIANMGDFAHKHADLGKNRLLTYHRVIKKLGEEKVNKIISESGRNFEEFKRDFVHEEDEGYLHRVFADSIITWSYFRDESIPIDFDYVKLLVMIKKSHYTQKEAKVFKKAIEKVIKDKKIPEGPDKEKKTEEFTKEFIKDYVMNKGIIPEKNKEKKDRKTENVVESTLELLQKKLDNLVKSFSVFFDKPIHYLQNEIYGNSADFDMYSFTITTPFKDYNHQYVEVVVVLYNNGLCNIYPKNDPIEALLKLGKDVDSNLIQEIIPDDVHIFHDTEDGATIGIEGRYIKEIPMAIFNVANAVSIIEHQIEATRPLSIDLRIESGKYTAMMNNEIVNFDFTDVFHVVDTVHGKYNFSGKYFSNEEVEHE